MRAKVEVGKSVRRQLKKSSLEQNSGSRKDEKWSESRYNLKVDQIKLACESVER